MDKYIVKVTFRGGAFKPQKTSFANGITSAVITVECKFCAFIGCLAEMNVDTYEIIESSTGYNMHDGVKKVPEWYYEEV